MIRNWLISSIRFLVKERIYSIINLCGIALGLTVVIIMGLYITDELGYDSHVPNADRTFLIRYDEPRPDGSVEPCGIVGGGMVKALTSTFPEVETATRVQMFDMVELTYDSPSGEWSAEKVELRTMRAEPTFFTIFPNQILSGDSLGMLRVRRTCVLTRTTAERLFGEVDPIGRQLAVSTDDPYIVTAVVEDMPRKSHLQFDLLLPLLEKDRPWYADYETWAVSGYCRLIPGADIRALELGIDKLVAENTEIQQATAHLVPIRDLHLRARDMIFAAVNVNPGDIQQVLLLGLIAVVVLLIATFNYVNLTTARAVTRSREVGLRKTVGATRGALLLHYMGESVLLVLISLTLALGLSELVMPYAGNLLNKDFSELSLFLPMTILGLVAIAVLIGVLAGVYPGLVLSGYSPIHAIRSQKALGSSKSRLRTAIVTLQFATAVVLLIGVMTILSQLHYIASMDMGYDREQVVRIRTRQNEGRQELIASLKRHDAILSASTSTATPGYYPTENYIALEDWSEEDLKNMSFKKMWADLEWFETVGIELVDGRMFREGSVADSTQSVLINETAAVQGGWPDPMGKWVQFFQDEKHYVIGVVKDFRFGSAREEIPPIGIYYNPSNNEGFLYVKLAPGRIEEGMKVVRDELAAYEPGETLVYEFLDDRFNELYRNDRAFARNVGLFSGLAIFISALGLFGLTAFATERRRKEVAVRKVLGATEPTLLILLSREMLQYVALANVIAWPVAWFAMSKWMESFVIRQALPLWPFLAASLMVLLFAALTIVGLVAGIVRSNPTNSLRLE